MKFRRILFFIILSALPLFVSAENLSLLPRYGGAKKTAELKKLDQEFVEAAIKVAGSRETAARQLIGKGFNALQSGSAEEAMRRFNQAWLLSPQDPEVAWGLGDASAAQGKFEEAFKLLEEARSALPRNPNVLNDLGFAYLQRAIRAAKTKAEATKDFDKAEIYFKDAAKADDKDDRAYFNMAIIEMYRGNYTASWERISQAEARGGKSIDARFVADLNKKKKRE